MDSRVAVVTGAASGIGRATVLAFERRGVTVVGADIAESPHTVRCDVTKSDDVTKLIGDVVAKHGRLDYAVNNAGIEGVRAMTADYDEAAWRRVIEVDLVAVFLCMKAELQVMLRQGGGAIVNVSSIMGSVAAPQASAYCAAKAGVIGLTKSAALEYAASGIRINAVCPGFIETPMVTERGLAVASDPAKLAQLLARQPMERLGSADEVAEAIVWLCSDAASFVTAHPLVIDGGFIAR